jgi:hypothetical protein
VPPVSHLRPGKSRTLRVCKHFRRRERRLSGPTCFDEQPTLDKRIRQVDHSPWYRELCPVHRSLIAMSGSSGKFAVGIR